MMIITCSRPCSLVDNATVLWPFTASTLELDLVPADIPLAREIRTGCKVATGLNDQGLLQSTLQSGENLLAGQVRRNGH